MNNGWKIFKITPPHGESFRISFKEDTLRIRKAGWKPIELVGLQEGETEVVIRYEDYQRLRHY